MKIYRVTTVWDDDIADWSRYDVAAKDFDESVQKVKEHIKVKGKRKQHETVSEVEVLSKLDI